MLFGNKKTYVIDYETLTDPRIAEFVAFGLMTVLPRLTCPSPAMTVLPSFFTPRIVVP